MRSSQLLRTVTCALLSALPSAFSGAWSQTHKNDGPWSCVGGDGQAKDVLEHRDQDLQASGCHEAPDEGLREVDGHKTELHEAQAYLLGEEDDQEKHQLPHLPDPDPGLESYAALDNSSSKEMSPCLVLYCASKALVY